jgi:3-hydroxymyristoyl/3-hydroxydecanoyl-(acyl carrier protein) dehydratase
MIDRVLVISGDRGNLKPPASITTEFDIPEKSWFINENHYSGIPLGVLMEIALQPCGILSAYLGTPLTLPADVNLFRNLDGEISFIATPNLAGKTVTNHSKLLNSVSGGGMLIQKYSFELSIGESVFLKGNSSFGYFTQVVMERQTGIDASKNDFLASDGYRRVDIDNNLPKGDDSFKNHLDLIDRLSFKENGGKYGCGVIIGEKILSGSEWFYTNHFFQDPVMPGSLGIEAIIQGLWAFENNTRDKNYFQDPVVDFSHSDPFSWKYRGQVTPASKKVNFEIHLKTNQMSDSSINILADADFWVDGIKIYTTQNISMAISKGKQ